MPLALAMIGSAIIGGGASILGANSAAKTSANAANQANQTQLNMFNTARGDLSPYNLTGQGANNALLRALGLDGSGKPIPTEDWAAYAKANPDVGTTWLADHPAASVGDVNGDGMVDDNDSYAAHYLSYGKGEGRQVPTIANPITGGNSLLSGYSGQPPTYTPYGQSPGGQSAPVYTNFNPTIADLEKTPGYQFTLDQGLKATQNGYAARGLGISGAAMKGAADYATGLAGTTLQQNFNIANQNYGNKVLGYTTGLGGYTQDFGNQLNQFQTGYNAYNTTQGNLYNRLFGIAGLGENAGAQTGNQAVQTGASLGGNLTSAGNAGAAAQVSAGNTIGGIAASIPNAFLTNKLLSLYGGGGGAASQAALANNYGAVAGSGLY